MLRVAVVAALLSASEAFQPTSLRPLAPTRAARRVPHTPVCEAPGSFEEQQKAAERAETVEYFKTLGGFSFGSLGLFAALTTGAGLDDVIAGNIVLVALCAYGSYLLFFDGGVTQAALEQQAIQQLADEEGDIMASAPRANILEYDAKATVAEPTPAIQTLTADGYARVNRVISPSAASTLLEFVNQELTKQREQVMDGSTAESMRFGDVLSRDNRFDLKLDLDPPVREALNEAIESIKPVFAGTLGEDAELFELAALVSDPRSPRQPVHPDTPFRQGEGAAAVTAFVALQVSTHPCWAGHLVKHPVKHPPCAPSTPPPASPAGCG